MKQKRCMVVQMTHRYCFYWRMVFHVDDVRLGCCKYRYQCDRV